MHLMILLVLFLILCVPYFIPTIVAYSRQKTNRNAILAVNVLLGWTFVGWVVALVWALKTDLVDRPAQ